MEDLPLLYFFAVLPIITSVKKRAAIAISISEAPKKEYLMPNCEAIIPAMIGPAVCPMSIIEPSVPIADPLVLCLLKSAINADVAEVTMERQRPNNILIASSAIKDLKKKKLPIQNDPVIVPNNI
jgi:hypothetical protein